MSDRQMSMSCNVLMFQPAEYDRDNCSHKPCTCTCDCCCHDWRDL